MGFPAPNDPSRYGGRTLNALNRQVEVPYPTIDPEVRQRVEEFIGCTLEQSYSEFTVELKNAWHRLMSDLDVDHSRPARHRGHAKRRSSGARNIW
jgi:hypothetical protein